MQHYMANAFANTTAIANTVRMTELLSGTVPGANNPGGVTCHNVAPVYTTTQTTTIAMLTWHCYQY